MTTSLNLGREIARQYLARKHGDDRSYLAHDENGFAFIEDRAIVFVLYDEVPEIIRAEALHVFEHEQKVA